MNDTLKALGERLGWNQVRLHKMGTHYRKVHGEEWETHLERRLRTLWNETRDKVRLLGRHNDYVEHHAGAINVRGAEGEPEPEAVPEEVQEKYTREGWNTHQVLKGEELARRETRRRAENARQAEMSARAKGVDVSPYTKAIDKAVDEMRRAAGG